MPEWVTDSPLIFSPIQRVSESHVSPFLFHPAVGGWIRLGPWSGFKSRRLNQVVEEIKSSTYWNFFIISSEGGRWRGTIGTNSSSTWSRLGWVGRRGSQLSGEICGQKIGRDDLIPCFQRPTGYIYIYIYISLYMYTYMCVGIFWFLVIKFEVYFV